MTLVLRLRRPLGACPQENLQSICAEPTTNQVDKQAAKAFTLMDRGGWASLIRPHSRIGRQKVSMSASVNRAQPDEIKAT